PGGWSHPGRRPESGPGGHPRPGWGPEVRGTFLLPHAYAPRQVDAVLNTDEVASACPTEARGGGPFVLVKFRGGGGGAGGWGCSGLWRRRRSSAAALSLEAFVGPFCCGALFAAAL